METLTQQNPPMVRLRYNYVPIIQAIVAASGNWYPVDPQLISGTSKATKQNRLWQAATQRGLKIQTSFQPDGFLYARLISAVAQ
jgi:hypothetical protein